MMLSDVGRSGAMEDDVDLIRTMCADVEYYEAMEDDVWWRRMIWRNVGQRRLGLAIDVGRCLHGVGDPGLVG